MSNSLMQIEEEVVSNMKISLKSEKQSFGNSFAPKTAPKTTS